MLELITGVPGAGKTTYAVARVLPRYMSQKVEGLQGARIVHQGGIKDLLLDHEPVHVPALLDWDGYDDKWSKMDRQPGQPPLDVPHQADNWHLWMMPGDVLLVDEAQRLFKPSAPGRKVPAFISRLETHRHYGVDIILITQHPNLLHTNVRALVGFHCHVRKLWFDRRMVYEWDRCTPVTQIKTAINSNVWTPTKKDWALFKSAELHTARAMKVPAFMIFAALAILLVPYLAWTAYSRTHSKISGQPVPDASKPALASTFAMSASAPASVVAYASKIQPLVFAPSEILGCYSEGDNDCRCFADRPYRVLKGEFFDDMCKSIIAGRVHLQASTQPRAVRPAASASAASAPQGDAPKPGSMV